MTASEELGIVAEMLMLEKKADAEAFHELTTSTPIRFRKDQGICLHPLSYLSRGFGIGDYPFIILKKNPGENQSHQFQAGSPITVFSTDDEDEKSIQGVINFIDNDLIKFTLYQNDSPDWIDNGKVGIQLSFDSRSYQSMEYAMNRVINAQNDRLAHLRDVLLGYKMPVHIPKIDFRSDTLNESQRKAVEMILENEDVSIVHGPPGTGKTTTLVAAVKELSNLDGQIMVCAPSNAAVDLLVRRISEVGIPIVRIGHLSRIDPDSNDHSLEVLIRNEKDYQEVKDYKRRSLEMKRMAGKYKRQFGHSEREQRKALYRESRNLMSSAKGIEDYLIQKCLDRAKVVACTLVGSDHFYLKDRKFAGVLIDESAQGLEPATWIPILKAEKVVLAGDPYQLPPTIKSRGIPKDHLEKTLMEKSLLREVPHIMLNVQYRMHEKIMAFSNSWFYGNELHAHASVKEALLFEGDSALEFIDTAGCNFPEERSTDGPSLKNSGELKILCDHLKELRERVSPEIKIAIISPYKEQVKHMRSQIDENEGIRINTIDSFQGQESDVVYISLVRSNDRNEIGFLKDYRRMNVAMTRAKMKLILIGDSATLGADEFYSKLLEFIEENGLYRSGWEWLE